MNRKYVPHVYALTVAVLVGCGQNSSGPSTGAAHATKVYSRAELDKLIAPGMSMREVTNTFGIPASVTQIEKSIVTLMYTFPLETVFREGGARLTGFDVHTKDGKVVDWSPIMGENRKMFQGSGETRNTSGEKTFQIFLVTDSLTNVVNTVDAEGRADASGLKAVAELVFKGQVFGGRSGNERPGEQTVILVVSEHDGLKLKDLTENNSEKRMLIVCRNQVVAAPAISTLLAPRQLRFTVRNSSILDSLESP